MKLPRFVQPPVTPTRSDIRIVVLTSILGFFEGHALAQAANTLPFVRRSLDITAADMSQLLGIVRLGAVVAVLLSLLGDRRGRRRVLLGAFVAMLVANAATAIAPDVATFTILQTVVRMTGSAVGALALVMLAESLTPALRAYGISIFGGAVSFGAGTALVLIPISDLGPESWRFLYGASALGLAFYPFVALRLRESPLFVAPSEPTALWSPLLDTQKRPFWIVAVLSFLSATFSAPAATFAMERLVGDVGLRTPVAVGVLLAGGTLGGLGFLVGGRSSDLWGRRPVLFGALLLAGVGGVGMFRLTEPAALAAAAAISGFGAFATVPSLGALRSELFPTRMRATAVMWLNVAGVLGAVTGLAAGSYLIGRFGLSTTITALAACMLIAAGLVLAVPETRGRILEPG
ncbi:putative 3-hydroxyphenylpropionic transporter MhpT [bacterium BMS3Abin02]|nr:putative 3-hydroxyphenylpropionic transporter MhpT [bacterium BMS3Abin02]GBE23678.1 putative 3-hydroxyphenylpropionic transporter MhpT [bacterium BMS3Bbin01]HDH24572.1 MFS transporter [Actinomycetota bacterium]HDL50337.1 MFS transporter [Actinomycetota bacterium]